MADYDLIGNIAIIKGENKTKKQKIEQAKKILEAPGIKTVVEKIGNVSGRLRTIKIKHISGEKNLIADYLESGCRFKLDVSSCYFSPRLSNDRKSVALKIKKNSKVLVMFAGVGIYPIIINKYSSVKRIVGVELGRECCRYFKENLKLNKIPEGKIEIVQGDVKKKIISNFEKFDFIMMARPNLKNSFLEQGLIASKKGTIIFYHAFCKDSEIEKICRGLVEEANQFKRKIKILNYIRAGDIAPFKHRFRVEIRVLN
jgi:tRNA (guanine37-N1)-methyltransferase